MAANDVRKPADVEVGKAIRLLRSAAGFGTAKALANEIGTTPTVITEAERGNRRPSGDTATAIEDAVGAPRGTLTRVSVGSLSADDAVGLVSGVTRPDDHRLIEQMLKDLHSQVLELAAHVTLLQDDLVANRSRLSQIEAHLDIPPGSDSPT